MSARSFFRGEKPLTIAELAALTGAELRRNPDPERRIAGIAVLDRAGPQDLVFLDNLKFAVQMGGCVAGACLVTEQFASFVPERVAVLVADRPFPAFVAVARALYPDALRPSSLFEGARAPGAVLHPDARLESGVAIDPGAVIGPRAERGSGTFIGANAVIGPDVHIGRNCSIGPNTSIIQALIGDRVIIHAGCQIGQDGFGYIMSPGGHRKIPQVGRVIIQDDVEIGAGSAIDRGAFRDTVIGEGTKIDNQVQVGHNVTIGRHCVLVAQSGVAGSATLEDYVVLGAKVGIKDHLTIGEGAQIAASSNLGVDVPAGERWAGTPARPYAQWVRQERYLTRIGRKPEGRDGRDDG
jgi:UDP-3-O-[3-hydroxymyristoyl] glucosamine N-acyltransferase